MFPLSGINAPRSNLKYRAVSSMGKKAIVWLLNRFISRYLCPASCGFLASRLI